MCIRDREEPVSALPPSCSRSNLQQTRWQAVRSVRFSGTSYSLASHYKTDVLKHSFRMFHRSRHLPFSCDKTLMPGTVPSLVHTPLYQHHPPSKAEPWPAVRCSLTCGIRCATWPEAVDSG